MVSVQAQAMFISSNTGPSDMIADLHIHSEYSGATSYRMTLDKIVEWCEYKGIDIVSTGDCLNEFHLQKILDNVEFPPSKLGRLRHLKSDLLFCFGTEVCLEFYVADFYKRIHVLMFFPDQESVEVTRHNLVEQGHALHDGRPTLYNVGITELIDISCNRAVIIPAHIWTPWFGLFGAKSGFSSFEQLDYYGYNLDMVETGLSSDIEMNGRISMLDDVSCVSFSDAHCVAPDTKVLLSNGIWRYIKDITIKDKVFSTHNKSLVETSIKKKHEILFSGKLYIVKTKSNKIVVSPHHRFFLMDGNEVMAQDLSVGDMIKVIKKVTINSGKIRHQIPPVKIAKQYCIISEEGKKILKDKRLKVSLPSEVVSMALGMNKDHLRLVEVKYDKVSEEHIETLCKIYRINFDLFKNKYCKPYHTPLKLKYFNYNFCQMLGYVIGDGHLYLDGILGKLELTDKNVDLLNAYGRLIKKYMSDEYNITKSKFQNSYRLRMNNCPLLFVEGFKDSIFKLAKVKFLPEYFLRLSDSSVNGLLAGLFDAEGTINNHSVSFASSSKKLIYQVQLLLLRLSISSCIYKDFEKIKRKWRYKLEIYGRQNIEMFYNKVKFFSVPKKKKLKKLIQQYRFIKVSVSNSDDSWKNEEDNITFRKIKSIKILTVKNFKLYDLSISELENYIAEGYVTHNSPEKIGREATLVPELDTFDGLISALRSKPKTLEWYPHLGKYHYTGHRACMTRFKDDTTTCPVCYRQMTIGVHNRLYKFIDRSENQSPQEYIYVNSLKEIAKVAGIKMTFPIPNIKELLVFTDKEHLNKLDSSLKKYVEKYIKRDIMLSGGYDGVFGKFKFKEDDLFNL